ncbi:restriction endonuclease type II-like protein [Kockovaella imperatae]|uniref:Restriction endonuclease type II-like protein n=1 Tax=Kockovaella imperatae TaxID=4999 RepID=A0A1Y1UMK2_9TREE|nr:restriction endonuclease type II-like protein [Kockovaella imperatae]ORX39280.1 restriction endonuclease type II-like protein [Kockovaella imperatae]
MKQAGRRLTVNQRRNPVLQSIKNVGIEIGDIVADYQVGTHNGVLFLSLKYHRLHPEYIHQRIEKMKNMYNVRILLILCDVNEHQQSIRDLSKIAIVNNLTTIVAWSNDEVAQYLTTFKAYEHKSDDSLKEKVHQEYHDQLQHVLTSGKKVNKTDADNLASQFGSFADIVKQPSKLLSNVKGLGATKVTSLLDAFNKPFLVGGLKRKAEDSAPEIITSSNVRHSNDERIEDIHSPDWPMDDMDAEDALRDTEIERQRGRAPSRSPDIGPGDESGDDEVRGPPADVWKDPLDDEDDEDDDDELGSGSSSKRARVEK